MDIVIIILQSEILTTKIIKFQFFFKLIFVFKIQFKFLKILYQFNFFYVLRKILINEINNGFIKLTEKKNCLVSTIQRGEIHFRLIYILANT